MTTQSVAPRCQVDATWRRADAKRFPTRARSRKSALRDQAELGQDNQVVVVAVQVAGEALANRASALEGPVSITFRSTWDGAAAFDVTPPAVSVSGASARKLVRPSGAWRVLTSLVVDDAEGAATSWQLLVSDRRKPLLPLASKSGESANGSIRVAIQMRLPTGTRVLRLQVDATDAVGNHASSVKLLRLP